MTVVVRDPAVGGYQNIVFDGDFTVAGNRHVVPNKSPVADTQGRTIMESAGRNCETTAEADVVANMEQGVSADVRQ